MKYIVFGLGSFGSSLSMKLTEKGNEVIGIDKSMAKVDALKEKISHTICLDAKDQLTVVGLPLKDADVVIVAIGEDEGANVMVTALLKNYGVKRLISRAINPLHENVLQALGVDEIVHPEEETAERWSKKLCLRGVIDSFDLSQDFSIVEIVIPKSLIGKQVREINFREKYNLLLLTTIKRDQVRNSDKLLENAGFKVQGVAPYDLFLEQDDILVIYGSNREIQEFVERVK